ncbi:MAG: DUF3095 family protein [Flavisolibacter sp.]|nr:DUF3095 family protein [Flavisolibacter sp.]
MTDLHFYRDLKPLKLPTAAIFEPSHFSAIPEGWFVIISDVKNSTGAVNAGRHNDVNLVAAGSLIAALNVARNRDVEIPYLFGGDGGTMLVPELLLKDVLAGLVLHNENSKKNFGLEMHIGSMAVRDIVSAGHFIRIAKQQIDSYFTKEVIIGDGLRFAEQKIKHSLNDPIPDTHIESELNLNGLECRWDKVKPPVEENEIVCYIIEAVNPEQQVVIYKEVLTKIETIYGDMNKRHPLSMNRLKLLLGYDKLKKEMLVKYGRWKTGYFISALLSTLIGKIFLKYNLKTKGLNIRAYLEQLIAHSDILTIDGRINTIISGSIDKRIQFTNYLSEQEKAGHLIYSYHINKESIMTCYIEDRNEKHIHFVDGSDGGYTEASKEYKRKLMQAQMA